MTSRSAKSTNDTTRYQLFRKPNNSGGTKDWAVGINGDQLRVRHCTTGSTANLRVIESASVAQSLEAEMANRVDKKRKEGYEHVGEAVISKGRLVETSSDSSSGNLFWEIKQPLNKDTVMAFLRETAQQLESLVGKDVKFTAKTGLSVTTPLGTAWRLGYSIDGGLQDTGRGGGSIYSHYGPLPVLILMAFQAAFKTAVVIIDKENNVVDLKVSVDNPYLETGHATYNTITDFGVALGLCRKPIAVSNPAQPGLWF
jgi:predicted DNA-binding WGR domain protein